MDSPQNVQWDEASINAVRRLRLIDSLSEESFKRLTRLASRMLNTPISGVTLVGDDCSHLKSPVGISENEAPLLTVPNSETICQYVINDRRTVVVCDTRQEPRMRDIGLVREMGVRSYLGIPLTLSDGVAIGSFCVADLQPRDWSDDDVQTMEDLAASVICEIELRRFAQALKAQAEETNRERTRHTAILESALDCIITIDHQGRVVEFNPAAERTFGYARDDVIGKLMSDLIMPVEHRELCLIGLERVLNTGESEVLDQRIERPALRADGTTILTEMTITRIDLPDHEHPLFTAYIRDITERKKAEEDIRFFKRIVEAVGQAVVASDNDRRIVYVNPAAERALNRSSEETVGRDVRDVAPADEFWELANTVGKEVRESGTAWSGELTLRRGDGELFPALVTVAPLVSESGETTGTIGLYTDISSLKESERQVRFYNLLFEAVGQAVSASDTDGYITYWNAAAEELLGWSADEVVGRHIHDVVVDKDHLEKASRARAAARSGRSWSGELPLLCKDGTELPAIVSLNPVHDDEGNVSGVIGVYTDITHIKETERDLRFHKHLADAVGQAVIANDDTPERRITYWNRAAEEMLGWSEEEALGQPLYELLPAPGAEEQMASIGVEVRQGQRWHGEFHIRHRDGSVIPALTSVSPVLDEDGALLGVIAAFSHIGELKSTEQELRFHKYLVDAVGQALIANDNSPERRITYWNRAAEEIMGWKAEEVLGRDVRTVVPGDDFLRDVPEIGEQVRAGNIWSANYSLRRRDGTQFPALGSVAPVLAESGEVTGLIGAYTDISQLKETERQLRFHKHIVDAVGQAVVVSDPDGYITYWNKAAEQIYGWRAEEVLGKPVFDVLPARETRDTAKEITRKIASGGTWSGEFIVRDRDGSEFPAYFTDSPIQDSDGNIIGVLGVSHDITERKEYERQIHLHKIMLDTVGQAVVATDRDLRVTYWNRAAEHFYGWSASEVLGGKLLDLFPSQSAGLFQAVNVIETLSREGKWSGEMTTYHRDGEEISALVIASLLLDDDGNQIGILAAATDITERKLIEEALRESNHRIVQILETMGDGFFSLDREWNFTYVNRQAEHLLRRDRDELLGRNVWDEFPHATGRAFFERYHEAFDNRQPVSFTEYYPSLKTWFEVHAYPTTDTLSVFFRDITEQREAEIAIRNAEERYRTLVEQLPAVTFITPADDVGKLSYVSPQIEEMMGYTPQEWTKEPTLRKERIHPDDIDYVLREDAISKSSRDGFKLEYRQQTRDGEYRWLQDTARLIRDESGNPKYWQGLTFDITDQKLAEQQIEESEQRFRSLFDYHPDAVFSIDSSGRLLTTNPAFTDLTGYGPEDIGELRFVDLVVPDDRERVQLRFDQGHRGEPQEFHAAIIDKEGSRAELRVTSIPIIVDGAIVGVHIVGQDVTDRHELENQLAYQAFHDSLTGLPNRSLFQNRLALRLARTVSDDDKFAVLFFDLDDFKVVNDSLGHSAGDNLLIQVANRVRSCIREDDLLARLGGDEFTLLLESIHSQEDAKRLAERIAEVLQGPFIIDGHEVFASASVGIAIGDRRSMSADGILRDADLAMYEAKNAGKNQYAVFEPSMNSRAWQRLKLETEIRRAINRDEFTVHFQPIVDLQSGELSGAEALVRWHHPERGLLDPNQFIGVAEQSGLILPLGRWIIRHALAQLQEWRSLLPDEKPVRISLNLSAKQYQNPKLIEELQRIFDETGLDPQCVTLEITEGIAMDESVGTYETLQSLKELGVQLALDDFGTGFSALSYLKRFPIDIIKIDRSFVDGLGTEPEDTSIVEAVMATAKAMHLHVTAEGIETPEQLEHLHRLGCHTGQGYFISHPLSEEEMRELIVNGNHAAMLEARK